MGFTLLTTQSVTELFNIVATVCYLHFKKSTKSGFNRFIWMQSRDFINVEVTELAKIEIETAERDYAIY